MGIHSPTPIQELAIPPIKRRTDVLITAPTGTGKTLAFLLPVVHNLKEEEEVEEGKTTEMRPRALVLVPNRELALQVLSVGKQLAHHAKFSSLAVVGHKKQSEQRKTMERGVDLVVATPGRLLKHRERGNVFFTRVRYLVIDEADTMVDPTFLPDLEALLVPIRRNVEEKGRSVQVILASASVTGPVSRLCDKHFPGAQRITAPDAHQLPPKGQHHFLRIPALQKQQELLRVVRSRAGQGTLVFCNTIDSCRATAHFLAESGVPAPASLHGGIPPRLRAEEWAKFTSGEASVLVCTDIAARGLDTTSVGHVVNFDFPRTAVDYLHRAGRTARAGRPGVVTNLVAPRDGPLADLLQDALRRRRPLPLDASSSNARALASRPAPHPRPRPAPAPASRPAPAPAPPRPGQRRAPPPRGAEPPRRHRRAGQHRTSGGPAPLARGARQTGPRKARGEY
eukprot:tig00001265_g7908.t1